MRRLLEKLNEEKKHDFSRDSEFERRLSEILKRYKIDNDSFAAEVLHLHKTH
jgi:hypothetical protein